MELEVENRRIQEASRLKSEFLANMSHELRTPLNSIIGFSELLHQGQVGSLAPKQHEFVGDILNSGRHLLRLINDVLDLSKVESGTMQFRPEAASLEAIVHEVRGVLRTIADERGITVVSEIDPEIGEVQVDPGRLKQVLYNYLSNALKFSPAGGRVEVRALGEGSTSFRIEVQDHGQGIAREEQHRLFVEFEQIHGGRAKQHAGTGLGLALTRRLVEAQGGTVGVESELGAGATFHAYDEGSAKLVAEMLQHLGFRAVTASDGARALERARGARPCAVVLDLVMPGLDGFGFLEQFRAEPAWEGVPVFVWTVKDLGQEEHAALLQRAQAVLPKDGSGARGIVDTIRRHLPPAREGAR